MVSTAVAFALLLLVGDGGLDGAPWAPSACRALVVDSAHFNTRRIVRVASALALFVLPHAIGAPHPAESTEFNLPIEIVAEVHKRCQCSPTTLSTHSTVNTTGLTPPRCALPTPGVPAPAPRHTDSSLRAAPSQWSPSTWPRVPAQVLRSTGTVYMSTSTGRTRAT